MAQPFMNLSEMHCDIQGATIRRRLSTMRTSYAAVVEEPYEPSGARMRHQSMDRSTCCVALLKH
jgi:hypothetical protein